MSAEPATAAGWTAREAREIVIGGAVVVVLALVLAYSYGGSGVKSAVGAYTLIAKFNRIDGLNDGAEVFLAGIKVGTVSGQTLDDDYRAVVALQLEPGVKLPADTAVAIHTDGLFGSKFVVLDPGGRRGHAGTRRRNHLHPGRHDRERASQPHHLRGQGPTQNRRRRR